MADDFCRNGHPRKGNTYTAPKGSKYEGKRYCKICRDASEKRRSERLKRGKTWAEGRADMVLLDGGPFLEWLNTMIERYTIKGACYRIELDERTLWRIRKTGCQVHIDTVDRCLLKADDGVTLEDLYPELYDLDEKEYMPESTPLMEELCL